MKKLASLALVLALCLSLAVPALASGAAPKPDTFNDGLIAVTNVVKQEIPENESIGSFYVKNILTCVAPANISLAIESPKIEDDIVITFSLALDRIPAGKELQDLGADGSELESYDYGDPDMEVTEAGAYYLWVWEEHSDGGGGFGGYLLYVEEPAEIAPPVGPTTNKFTDVKQGDWFYDAVLWAVEKEITTGTTATTFSPMQTCTEAQILTFLWRAKGSPEPKNPVPSDTYYAKAAKWAVEQGIVDEFEATVPCTRAMTVEFLWKAAGKPKSNAKPAFTDIEGDGELAQAVAWAVEKGVTTGTSETTFTPDQICNRGQIVTFLYRNLK